MALTHQDELLIEASIETSIVDRVGAGDAFAAGFLHGYLDGDIGRALRLGVRLAALKMTIAGDIALISQQELDQSMSLPNQTIVR
jgi:2-dehydro-3-deoxygluconokinase